MTKLYEAVEVSCSPREAETRMAQFFQARRGPQDALRLHLRVPMGGTDSSRYAFDREVRVTLRLARDESGLNDVLHIAWQPEGTSMLPKFDGTLIVGADSDARHSVLELRGNYVPPMGAAGQLFDEAIGHRIAQSTARELLDDIRRSIEASREA
jgi:hypothetical protein